MLDTIFKCFISFAAAIPIHHYVMPELLRYINFPSGIGSLVMYFMIAIVIYELLKTSKKWNQTDHFLLILIYYVSLFYILFARPDTGNTLYEFNIQQLFHGLYYGSYAEWIVALFNILIFIPMPVVHQFYIKKNSNNFCTCLLVGISMELIQAISHRGVFDIGDIILYLLGIGIGMILKNHLK